MEKSLVWKLYWRLSGKLSFAVELLMWNGEIIFALVGVGVDTSVSRLPSYGTHWKETDAQSNRWQVHFFCITGWPIVDNQLNSTFGNRHSLQPIGGIHYWLAYQQNRLDSNWPFCIKVKLHSRFVGRGRRVQNKRSIPLESWRLADSRNVIFFWKFTFALFWKCLFYKIRPLFRFACATGYDTGGIRANGTSNAS